MDPPRRLTVPLVNDLLTTIATYTLPDATLSTMTLHNGTAGKLYGNYLWKQKVLVETNGAPNTDGDLPWYVRYRRVNHQYDRATLRCLDALPLCHDIIYADYRCSRDIHGNIWDDNNRYFTHSITSFDARKIRTVIYGPNIIIITRDGYVDGYTLPPGERVVNCDYGYPYVGTRSGNVYVLMPDKTTRLFATDRPGIFHSWLGDDDLAAIKQVSSSLVIDVLMVKDAVYVLLANGYVYKCMYGANTYNLIAEHCYAIFPQKYSKPILMLIRST